MPLKPGLKGFLKKEIKETTFSEINWTNFIQEIESPKSIHIPIGWYEKKWEEYFLNKNKR